MGKKVPIVPFIIAQFTVHFLETEIKNLIFAQGGFNYFQYIIIVTIIFRGS